MQNIYEDSLLLRYIMKQCVSRLVNISTLDLKKNMAINDTDLFPEARYYSISRNCYPNINFLIKHRNLHLILKMIFQFGSTETWDTTRSLWPLTLTCCLTQNIGRLQWWFFFLLLRMSCYFLQHILINLRSTYQAPSFNKNTLITWNFDRL